jgi:fluoride exporter
MAGWIGHVAGISFPWGTWAVNVVGCFAIELVLQAGLGAMQLSPTAVLTLTTGVLGGFTTYSAFNNQTLELVRSGAWATGLLYFGLTAIGCFGAGALGFFAGQALSSR